MTRRLFIRLLAAFPIGYLLFKYADAPTENRGAIIECNASDIPAGGALIYPDENIAMVLVNGRPEALSLECTHLGCTVSVKGNGFVCPCHGSSFDLDGGLRKGPAERNLDRHVVSVDSDRVTVFTEKISV